MSAWLGRGKVILLGEHAVVYGHAALAGALDRGVTCTLAPGPLRLRVPAWHLDVGADDDHPVAAALRAVADALGARPDVSLDAVAALPAAAGLGSSAAMAVAVTRALAAALDRPLDDEQVIAIASAAERCFHGNPSGVDVALATCGGLGLYRRGAGLQAIHADDGGALRVPLAIAIDRTPRSTAALVAKVAAARAAGAGADDDLRALGLAAERGARLCARRDLAGLGALFDDAHARLARLGVSTPALDRLCAIARDAGATGATLTGAGGGGAVIAIAPGREDAIVAAWQAQGVTAFACAVGHVVEEAR
ncbi:MAG: mevalonate kinase [Deltaproteobacteria bacterium]|nr:mevalonate kinase [Deltaproteobacteria bacterium]